MNILHTLGPYRPTRVKRSALHGLLCLSLLGVSLSVFAQEKPSTEAAAETPVTNSSLGAPLFYQLLLGELNVTAGEAGTGYSLILDAARKQNDARLFRRAVDIALEARSGEAALTAAKAWSQAIPGSTDADRFELQILLALNRVAETAPVLRRLIDQAPGANRLDAINGIPQIYARVADKTIALQVVREALAPSLKLPARAAAAWTSIGFMELANNQLTQALTSARSGHEAPGLRQ